LEGELEGHAKMKVYLEVLLELCFCTKPLKFGVEARMEAPTGVALTDNWQDNSDFHALAPAVEKVQQTG
jgi:hypothetical protein